MNVWRSGTTEWSRAWPRTSSSDGRISSWSAATCIKHLVGVGQREISRSKENRQVVEHVGGLLGHPLVCLLAGSARDLLGLLLHLRGDQRRVAEQLRGPAPLDRVGATVGDRALEHGQRL